MCSCSPIRSHMHLDMNFSVYARVSVYVRCSYIYIFFSVKQTQCGKRCRYYSVTVVKISHRERSLIDCCLFLSIFYTIRLWLFQTYIRILTFGYTHISHLFVTCLFVKKKSFFLILQKNKTKRKTKLTINFFWCVLSFTGRKCAIVICVCVTEEEQMYELNWIQ